MAANVFHVGPVGAAAALKLVNNLMTLGSYAVAMEAMEMGAAYGLTEDTITTVVSVSQGDSRLIRQWPRIDISRQERRELGESFDELYDMQTKDVRMAAVAGGHRGVVMPMTQTAVTALGWSSVRRDHKIAVEGLPDVPRCSSCGLPLAAPFRVAGVHPECVDH
jgi:3-hydroxyisobutyrate dehydrogenase